MPLRVLRSLRRGDGLLLEGIEAPFDQWDGCALLTVAGRPLCQFDVRLTSGQLTHMSNMNPPNETSPAAEPDADDAPGALLDSLTVPVAVECDAGEMNLRELGDMRRGYVIELPWSLKEVVVRVVVSGHTLASGQLVAVGDRLAVRLDRMHSTLGDGDGN
jgi:type III secretion system YscQ/HrcQ family protein